MIFTVVELRAMWLQTLKLMTIYIPGGIVSCAYVAMQLLPSSCTTFK